MKKLRISTSCTLHPVRMDQANAAEYFRQGLAFHKKAGFDALDCPISRIAMEPEWEKLVDTMLEDSAQAGIVFELAHLPFNARAGLNWPQEEEEAFALRMHRAIDAAERLGVSHAVLHPLSVTVPEEAFVYQEWFQRAYEHLAPFAEHAAKIGLPIAVENMRCVPAHYPTHRYCQNAEELCALADRLHIDVCWDFGHANISRVIHSEALTAIVPRLKVLHVNDNHGMDDVHLPPFMGTTDWTDAMKGLGLCGFDGLFNYEVSAGKIPFPLREDLARYLVHAARELMEMI